MHVVVVGICSFDLGKRVDVVEVGRRLLSSGTRILSAFCVFLLANSVFSMFLRRFCSNLWVFLVLFLLYLFLVCGVVWC